MTPEQTKAEATVSRVIPELMELSFGCEVKHNKIVYKFVNDWDVEDHGVYSKVINLYSEIEDKTGGDYTAHVSDLEPETYEILGHPIQLHHWLRVLGFKIELLPASGMEMAGEDLVLTDYTGKQVRFNLTTGQPATELDFKTFNEICN